MQLPSTECVRPPRGRRARFGPAGAEGWAEGSHRGCHVVNIWVAAGAAAAPAHLGRPAPPSAHFRTPPHPSRTLERRMSVNFAAPASAARPRVTPPRLAPGARVALVSPAGPLRGEEDVARAVDNARGFGWEPVVGEHALARSGYFAGPDEARLADVNRALADDAVDAVWCIRGGYGAMRLLDALDYAALARRPKALIGYSDVT